MNITENNKLIAEFMGYKIKNDIIYIHTYLPNKTKSELQYNKSWDLLMPVIKKCLIGEAEHNENIAIETIKIIYENLCEQNINGVYNSCVKFIKFKNKLK